MYEKVDSDYGPYEKYEDWDEGTWQLNTIKDDVILINKVCFNEWIKFEFFNAC